MQINRVQKLVGTKLLCELLEQVTKQRAVIDQDGEFKKSKHPLSDRDKFFALVDRLAKKLPEDTVSVSNVKLEAHPETPTTITNHRKGTEEQYTVPGRAGFTCSYKRAADGPEFKVFLRWISHPFWQYVAPKDTDQEQDQDGDE